MTFMPHFLPTLRAIREATGCDERVSRIAWETDRNNGLDAMIEAARIHMALDDAREAGIDVAAALAKATAQALAA